MAIVSVTCPNCGATDIQIDTTREHSFCSYCGSTVKTKDVLHLDVESMTLAKLKANAEKSFKVGQYGNARADWEKATQLDRTDHESYFGTVRCDMAMQPDRTINEAGFYSQALAYASSEIRMQYKRQVEAHNTRIREAQDKARIAQEAYEAEARAIQGVRDAEAHAKQVAHDAKISEAEATVKRLRWLRAILLVFSPLASFLFPYYLGVTIQDPLIFNPFVLWIVSSIAIGFIMFFVISGSQKKLDDVKRNRPINPDS